MTSTYFLIEALIILFPDDFIDKQYCTRLNIKSTKHLSRQGTLVNPYVKSFDSPNRHHRSSRIKKIQEIISESRLLKKLGGCKKLIQIFRISLNEIRLRRNKIKNL